MPESLDSRSIARFAVKAQLARVAMKLFQESGYENVTINDLAAASGVSASTIIRYFGSKQGVVLVLVEVQLARVTDALRARPLDEDDWTALRRALDLTLEPYRGGNHAQALAWTRIIQDNPALIARQLEERHSWNPALADGLASRRGGDGGPTVRDFALAAAALACLTAAITCWTESDGRLDLVDLADEAFASLSATPGGSGSRPRTRRAGRLNSP
jgi:AcrR family transcriptional regulator